MLTKITDQLGFTDLCPNSGTLVVSAIIQLNNCITTHALTWAVWEILFTLDKSETFLVIMSRLHFRSNKVQTDHVYIHHYSEGCSILRNYCDVYSDVF